MQRVCACNCFAPYKAFFTMLSKPRLILIMQASLLSLASCGGGSTDSGNGINSNGGDGATTSAQTTVESNTSASVTGTPPLAGFALPDISNVKQFGWVAADEYPDEVTLSASFFLFKDEVTPTAELITLVLPNLDTCSITKKAFAALDPTGTGIPPDIEFDIVSAGDVLVFSNDQGTLVSLFEQSQFGFNFYSIEPGADLLPPLAADIKLDIPGAEFPAFAGATVPNVNPLEGVALAADADIQMNEVFTWIGDNDPFSRIIIKLEGYDTDQDAVTIECDALDDGDFTLPNAYVATLASDRQLSFKSMNREVFSATTDGDAALLVYHSSHPQ